MPLKGQSVAIAITAWDTAANAPKTGLADGNITLLVSQDGAAGEAATNAVTELAYGEYSLTLTADECDADTVTVYGTTDQAGVVVIPVKLDMIALTGVQLAADQQVDVVKVAGAAVAGVDDFKADVSSLATQADIAGLIDSVDANTVRLTAVLGNQSTIIGAFGAIDVTAVAGAAVAGVGDFRADVSALATSAQAASILTAVQRWTGSGDVSVDHDYGGTDAMRIVDGDGNGVDNATIRVYEATAYQAGGRTVIAQATTGSDGRWESPVYLDAGDYYLIINKAGAFEAYSHQLTVTA